MGGRKFGNFFSLALLGLLFHSSPKSHLSLASTLPEAVLPPSFNAVHPGTPVTYRGNGREDSGRSTSAGGGRWKRRVQWTTTHCSNVQIGKYVQLHFYDIQSCFEIQGTVRANETVSIFYDFYNAYETEVQWNALCKEPKVTLVGEGVQDIRVPDSERCPGLVPREEEGVHFSVTFFRLPPVHAELAHPIRTDYFFLSSRIVRTFPRLNRRNAAEMHELWLQTCAPFRSTCLWQWPGAKAKDDDGGEGGGGDDGREEVACSPGNGFTCDGEGEVTGIYLAGQGVHFHNLTQLLLPFSRTLRVLIIPSNPVSSSALSKNFFEVFAGLLVLHAEYTDLGGGRPFPCPPSSLISSSSPTDHPLQSVRISWTSFQGPIPVCWLSSPQLRVFSADFAGLGPRRKGSESTESSESTGEEGGHLVHVLEAVGPNLLDLSLAGSGIFTRTSLDKAPLWPNNWSRSNGIPRPRFLLVRLNLAYNPLQLVDAKELVLRILAAFPQLQALLLRMTQLEGAVPPFCQALKAGSSAALSPSLLLLDMSHNRIQKSVQSATDSCKTLSPSEEDGSREESTAVAPLARSVNLAFNGLSVRLPALKSFFLAGGMAILEGNTVPDCPFRVRRSEEELQDKGETGDGSLRWFAQISSEVHLCSSATENQFPWAKDTETEKEGGPYFTHLHSVSCSTCTVVSVLLVLAACTFFLYGGYQVCYPSSSWRKRREQETASERPPLSAPGSSLRSTNSGASGGTVGERVSGTPDGLQREGAVEERGQFDPEDSPLLPRPRGYSDDLLHPEHSDEARVQPVTI